MARDFLMLRGSAPRNQPVQNHVKAEHITSSKAPPVLDDFTKDQLIEKLYLRIRHMENSMREKDERIDQLCRQNEKLMEIVQHRKRDFERKNSNCDSPSTPPFSHRGRNSTEFDVLNGLDYNIFNKFSY
uniref:Uncharacterized protein n=1 Tax=Ditylenchus dipsaci TaxID=166011 RepID=A0A915E1J5_9BILA